ncbi:hypothetical protein PR048_033017 [Dryococelus australis]|uniref:Uncharacterized protein n=1 Tax=Dryococelus australis TaxID=614101 RepID=A0ABQ9G4N0_9NEOP|nr:hypothetical protein PR048_033017 [Dryococelus australis]
MTTQRPAQHIQGVGASANIPTLSSRRAALEGVQAPVQPRGSCARPTSLGGGVQGGHRLGHLASLADVTFTVAVGEQHEHPPQKSQRERRCQQHCRMADCEMPGMPQSSQPQAREIMTCTPDAHPQAPDRVSHDTSDKPAHGMTIISTPSIPRQSHPPLQENHDPTTLQTPAGRQNWTLQEGVRNECLTSSFGPDEHPQKITSECLLVILSLLKYLAMQGLAVRGHLNNKGNFMELLQLRSLDDPHMSRLAVAR